MAFEFSRRAGRLTRRWAELRKTSCVSRRKPFKSIFMMHPDKIECLFVSHVTSIRFVRNRLFTNSN